MYGNVLVPTDGSDPATGALDHAIDVAREYGATLHLLYVIEQVPTGGDAARGVREMGQEALEDAVERARARGVEDVETKIVSGTAHRAILDYADEHDVDLLVMGTHGRTGLQRYLLGSVTEKVVRLSDRPVLTVRPTGSEE